MLVSITTPTPDEVKVIVDYGLTTEYTVVLQREELWSRANVIPADSVTNLLEAIYYLAAPTTDEESN